MDLEQMKQGWNKLSERLAQNEMINQRMIKEMITRKTNSAYNAIYQSNKRGLIATFLIGALLLPFAKMQGMPIYRETFIALESFILLGFLYECYMFYLLSRFNLTTMKADEAMWSMLRYKKLFIDNQRYGKLAILLIVVICMGLQKAFTLPVILFTVLFSVVAIFLWRIEWKRHNQSLKEIEEGLQELREMQNGSSRSE